jgi:hypothetical protein
MPDWVFVNGARIEKSYLEANIAEAKKYKWEKFTWTNESVSHRHCIICNVPIPKTGGSTGEEAYKSIGGYLCEYCYDNFISSIRA